MASLIEKYTHHNFFGNLLGMDFKVIKPGEVHYTLKIEEKHLATPNAAHGGVISSLMDALLGVTGLSEVEGENKVVSTIEFKINFLSPALLNDELLGVGKIIQKGNRLLIISGDIFCTNRQNVIIAKAIGTFNSYPAEKAGY